MKELLSGETRGYQGIRVLCQLLDDPNNRSKIALLRGAVFFVSTSINTTQQSQNSLYFFIENFCYFCDVTNKTNHIFLKRYVLVGISKDFNIEDCTLFGSSFISQGSSQWTSGSGL
jgi:hypothetical protein